jgi:hypothetical protein
MTEDKITEEIRARRGRPPKVEKADDTMATEDKITEEVSVIRETKAAEEPKLFPVMLVRNYHPINEFLIGGVKPTVEQRTKVFAGTAIEVDKAEALDMMAKGIAVRNDPIY